MNIDKKNLNKNILIFSAIFIFGLLLRLLYLHQYSFSPLFYTDAGSDVYDYSCWAKEILSGKWGWDFPKIHSPLYAYFLALLYYIFSIKYFYIRLAQELLGLLIAVPVLISLKESGAKKKIIILTALIWSWYPPLIYYSAEFTCELLLMLMLSMSMMLIYISENPRHETKNNLRTGLLFSAGFFMGLANITHPISLILTATETLYLLISSLKKKNAGLLAAIIFAGASLIPVMSVVSYNSFISGELFPVQRNSGYNFWLGNNENSTGTCYIRPGTEWENIHNKSLENQKKTGQNPEQYFYSKSFHFITGHPIQWAKLLFKKFLMTLNGMEYTSGPDLFPVKYFTIFQKTQFWAFGAVLSMALAFLAASFFNPKKIKGYRHFIMLFISYLAALTVTVTSGRYRIPMIIAIIPFASAFIVNVFFSGKYPSMKHIFLWGVFIIIAFLPVYTPNMIKEEAESLSLSGEANLASGEYANAVSCIKQSLAKYPDMSPDANYNMLGAAYTNLGNLKEAVNNFNTLLKLKKTGKASAYSNIANIYDQAGNYEQAELNYKKALDDLTDVSEKELSEIYYNYAVFLERTKIDEAEKYYTMAIEVMPFNTKALNNLAILHLRQNRPDKAVPLLKKAVRFSPDNVNYGSNLSYAEKKLLFY